VHQVGPLSVYAETNHLGVFWYFVEQSVSVAVTIAALGAACWLLARRVPPLRPVVEGVCEARWPLLLAAALASRSALRTFLPDNIVTLDDGLSLALRPVQWLWLVALVLAVASLMLRAACRYLVILRPVVPSGWRVFTAMLVLIFSGEIIARLLTSWLYAFLFWPP
jgi:hypothetical protein